MKCWFQAFAVEKWVSLYRYSAVQQGGEACAQISVKFEVGICKLKNQVDPWPIAYNLSNP